MQAVILAAGKGVRCIPFTLTKPKALLKIGNKTLLQHNLGELEGLVDEVIIITGYLGDMIKKSLGECHKKIKITYVGQKQVTGTGTALITAQKLLEQRFLVLNGDDLYSREDIKRCLRHEKCILVKHVDDPEKWGIVEVEGSKVIGFDEKPSAPRSHWANTGLYVLTKTIFQHAIRRSARGEYEITDYIRYMVEKNDTVACEKVRDYWMPVGYPWHILDANEFLLSRMRKSRVDGSIEKGAVIKGNILLGKGSVIKSGTYIEGNVVVGDNSTIGPNCYIRGATSIGDDCKIGNGVEIKNSVIGNKSNVPHLSYIGDSVIGDGVNIGAGTITANLRFDHGSVKVRIQDEIVHTNRKKLGACIGDDVQVGINVSLMPGIRIWPGARVLPHAPVYEDVKK